jgi:hypothetical protein
MDQIKDNVNLLRDSIQRGNYTDTTVIDIFTAFYVLSNKRVDYSITDDKYFAFLLGCLQNVARGRERIYWFDNMFQMYEQLANMVPSDPNWTNWILLKANLIYLSPIA